jgi:MYXO-CTERM domain-containing protein
MKYGATQSNNGRCVRFSGAGGAHAMGVVSSGTLKPVSDTTYTITWGTAQSGGFAAFSSTNGAGTTSSSSTLNVSNGTELTATGSMTGSGIQKTGSFAIGYDLGSSFCGAEFAEVDAHNVQPSAAQEAKAWVYAHNRYNTPFTVARGVTREDMQTWGALGLLAGAAFLRRRRRPANDVAAPLRSAA